MSLELPSGLARYFLILFQAGWRNDPLGLLDHRVYREIHEKLDEKVVSKPEETEIDLWLESPGGDAHASYKLFLDIRHRCRRLRAVIPDYAKSASTMLALGADEIVMAPSSELGPLDAQIEHPDREGIMVSALDVAGALSFLGDYALEYIMEAGKKLLQSTELPREIVLREISRFSAAFLRPVVTKLDPHMIHRAANQLDIARKYAEIMLNERRLDEQDKDQEFNAMGLVSHLVLDYPAHGFVISRKEAKSLRLPIKNTESYDKNDELVTWHKGFQKGLFTRSRPRSIIQLLSQSELESIFDHEDAGTGKEAPEKREEAHETEHEENQEADGGSS